MFVHTHGETQTPNTEMLFFIILLEVVSFVLAAVVVLPNCKKSIYPSFTLTFYLAPTNEALWLPLGKTLGGANFTKREKKTEHQKKNHVKDLCSVPQE